MTVSRETIRRAGFWWSLVLDAFGVAGVCLPWRVVYILPEYWRSRWVRVHEVTHLKQIARDGAVLWSWRVVWYCLRYGYALSPYEIEANKAANRATQITSPSSTRR